MAQIWLRSARVETPRFQERSETARTTRCEANRAVLLPHHLPALWQAWRTDHRHDQTKPPFRAGSARPVHAGHLFRPDHARELKRRPIGLSSRRPVATLAREQE